MKALRNMIALVAVVFLGSGYFASQLAMMRQEPSRFALQVDQPAIRMLSLVLLLGAIVLAFIPEKEDA